MKKRRINDEQVTIIDFLLFVRFGNNNNVRCIYGIVGIVVIGCCLSCLFITVERNKSVWNNCASVKWNLRVTRSELHSDNCVNLLFRSWHHFIRSHSTFYSILVLRTNSHLLHDHSVAGVRPHLLWKYGSRRLVDVNNFVLA